MALIELFYLPVQFSLSLLQSLQTFRYVRPLHPMIPHKLCFTLSKQLLRPGITLSAFVSIVEQLIHKYYIMDLSANRV